MGKIVKINNGQFALLTDEQAGKGVFLDDQEKAKQFEGKNVKATGVLDLANKILRHEYRTRLGDHRIGGSAYPGGNLVFSR